MFNRIIAPIGFRHAWKVSPRTRVCGVHADVWVSWYLWKNEQIPHIGFLWNLVASAVGVWGLFHAFLFVISEF
jgi:hypothetical protein